MKNLFATFFLVLAMGCSCQKGASKDDSTTSPAIENESTLAETGPAVLVYRTKTDHDDHVPVMLSDDGKTIVAYPDPSDLRTSNGPPKPTDLGSGYRLDNRGIGPNVAFLSMSYGGYATLEKAPSTAELMALIVDRDPLKELYHCGPRTKYSDVAEELKKIVAAGEIESRCEKLK